MHRTEQPSCPFPLIRKPTVTISAGLSIEVGRTRPSARAIDVLSMGRDDTMPYAGDELEPTRVEGRGAALRLFNKAVGVSHVPACVETSVTQTVPDVVPLGLREASARRVRTAFSLLGGVMMVVALGWIGTHPNEAAESFGAVSSFWLLEARSAYGHAHQVASRWFQQMPRMESRARLESP